MEVNGERHIADVRTPHGLVMEFQHSAITPVERTSRERFYINMIWIVDCTRLKTDRPRIDEHLPHWRLLQEGTVDVTPRPGGLFPKPCLDCAVPVLFDFDGLHVDENTDRRNHLICLLPHRFMDRALHFPVRRSTLMKVAANEATIFDWQKVHSELMQSAMQAPKVTYRGRRWRR